MSEEWRQIAGTGRFTEALYAQRVESLLAQLRGALPPATQSPDGPTWERTMAIMDNWVSSRTCGYFEGVEEFTALVRKGEWPNQDGCPECFGLGCLDCDFRGDKTGHAYMQEMYRESNEEWDRMNKERVEYIKRGVCSGCGATCHEDALKLCQPSSLGETGEMTCAGEDLWPEE